MIITVSGAVALEDIKEIVFEHLQNHGQIIDLTIYIPFDSYQVILQHPEITKYMVYMLPQDLMDGNLTLYGATIKTYFPAMMEEN